MFKPQKEQFKKAKEKKMFKISETKKPNTSRAWKTYSTSSPRDRRFPSRKRSGRRGRGYRSPCQLCRWLVAGWAHCLNVKMRKRRKELLLVKPVPQHTPRRPQPTDLYALRTPPLFAVEDGEGRPADLTLGGLAYGASFRYQSQLGKIPFRSAGFFYSPRILLFAFGSQLA